MIDRVINSALQFLLIFSAISLVCSQSMAYTPILTTNGNEVRWVLDEVPQDQPNIIEGSVEFFINRFGTPDIADNGDGTGGEFDILRQAFRAWEAVPTSLIDFNYLQLTDENVVTGTDRTNLIIFDDANGSGLFPLGTGVIALTLLTFEDEAFDGVFDGRIVDADMIFNGQDFVFSAGMDPAKMNLGSVATHEAGHVCGLDHGFHQKTNEEDLRGCVKSLYPGQTSAH